MVLFLIVDKKALFVFCRGDKTVYELIQFKEEFRSWFIGNSVQYGELSNHS